VPENSTGSCGTAATQPRSRAHADHRDGQRHAAQLQFHPLAAQQRTDRQAVAQVVQPDGGNVDSVDEDLALGELDHAEEHLDHRALAGTRAADDANLLTRHDVDRDAQQDRRQVGPVPHRHVALWMIEQNHI